jgi:hypothetical protein
MQAKPLAATVTHKNRIKHTCTPVYFCYGPYGIQKKDLARRVDPNVARSRAVRSRSFKFPRPTDPWWEGDLDLILFGHTAVSKEEGMEITGG